MIKKILGLFPYVRALERRARCDDLTGVLRRWAFFEALEREIENALKHSEHVSLVFVDMDEFGAINKAYGHAVGDHLLAWIGKRLAQSVPPSWLVGRMGGDEFILAGRIPEMLSGMEMVHYLKRVVGGTFRDQYTRIEIQPSMSVGYATTKIVGYTDAADALIRDADRSMSMDKNARRRVRNTPR